MDSSKTQKNTSCFYFAQTMNTNYLGSIKQMITTSLAQTRLCERLRNLIVVASKPTPHCPHQPSRPSFRSSDPMYAPMSTPFSLVRQESQRGPNLCPSDHCTSLPRSAFLGFTRLSFLCFIHLGSNNSRSSRKLQLCLKSNV